MTNHTDNPQTATYLGRQPMTDDHPSPEGAFRIDHAGHDLGRVVLAGQPGMYLVCWDCPPVRTGGHQPTVRIADEWGTDRDAGPVTTATRDLLSWSNGQGAQEEPVTGPCEASAHDEIDPDGVCERCGYYPGDPARDDHPGYARRDLDWADVIADGLRMQEEQAWEEVNELAQFPVRMRTRARFIPLRDAILVSALLDAERHLLDCHDTTCPDVTGLWDVATGLGLDDVAEGIAAIADHDDLDADDYRHELLTTAAAVVLTDEAEARVTRTLAT